MLNCNIIFNEVEYTPAEFKDLVLREGLGSLLGDSPSELATAIINKYEVQRGEESLAELWTRLEAQKRGTPIEGLVNEQQVKEALQPVGQLTDYDTQEQIRYNTYSGLSLIGIAASFGKTLGYTFEGEKVTAIKHGDEIIPTSSTEYLDLLASKGLKNTEPETFVSMYPEYSVAERTTPKFNDNYHFKINNQLIDGFSRTERNFYPNQKENVNIFETIDSIINLAVDNVKKQFLHVLGITNSNANMFLNMIAMGIPLNVVSRIFKTPAVVQLNEIGRLDPKKINNTNLNQIVQEILETSDEVLLDNLKQYLNSDKLATSFLTDLRRTSDPMAMLAKLGIQTDILDKVYTEQTTPTMKLLSDAAVLGTIKKIIPIGEQMFDYSQAFGLLRGLPNKKWRLDSVIDRIEKYHTFQEEKSEVGNVKDIFKNEITENFKKTEEYNNALAESEAAAEKLLNARVTEGMNNKWLFGTVKADIRANFVNRVIRKTIKRSYEPTNSVFRDNAILRIPHVFSAYRAALQTNAILESVFPVFNPVVKSFVNSLIEEANIFKGENVGQQVELVSKELLKFAGSNLTLTIGDKVIDLFAPEDFTYSSAGKTFSGKEAWAQQFINNMAKVIDAEEALDNEFLKAIEIDYNLDGSQSLKIIGDKINDEEALEQIREGFAAFAQDNTEAVPGITKADLAKDLFKYSLMVEGMYYEKTGFSLLFPTTWAVKYGIALDDRLSKIIPNTSENKHMTDINLAILKDKFMFQLLRNNPALVGFPRGVKALEQRKSKIAGKEYKSYSGTDDYAGQKIYFDIKFNKAYEDTAEKFIRRFGEDIYMLIPTPGAANTYYAKVTEKGGHRFYDLDLMDLETSLDLSPLQSGKYPLINARNIVSGKLTTEPREHLLEVGDTIMAFDKSSPTLKSVRIYKVTSANTTTPKFQYSLEFVATKSLLVEDLARELKTDMARFVTKRLGTTNIVDTLAEYKLIARRNKNVGIIVNETEDRDSATVLPIRPVPIGITKAEEDNIIREIGNAITKLDRKLNYYVSSKILSPLISNPTIYKAVAALLKSQIGFVDRNGNQEVESDGIMRDVYLALKRTQLGVWEIKKGTFDEVEGEKYTHQIRLTSGLNRVKVGSIMYAGNDNYFFVDDVTDSFVKATVFSGKALPEIDKPVLTRSEFESIYTKTIGC